MSKDTIRNATHMAQYLSNHVLSKLIKDYQIPSQTILEKANKLYDEFKMINVVHLRKDLPRDHDDYDQNDDSFTNEFFDEARHHLIILLPHSDFTGGYDYQEQADRDSIDDATIDLLKAYEQDLKSN